MKIDPSEGSFARASTGTYFDKDGVLRTAAVDEPRWNYTYEDGEWVGPELLVEEQRTNLFTNSGETLESIGTAVTPNAAIAPDGSMSMDLVTEQQTSGEHYVIDRTLTLTSGVTYTFSVFVKDGPSANRDYYHRVAGSSINGLRFKPRSKEITGSTFDSYGFVELSDGVFRVWGTYTPASTGSVVNRSQLLNGALIYTGDGTSGLYIWGAQLEVGDRPTSYIKTLGAPVTRAADIPGRIVSNVPENDAPVWTAGTYTQGTKRIQNHHVYEVLAESTTDAPADGVAKTPPTWLDLGVTNPWRAFDEKIGTVTTHPEAIRFSIRADQTINALAFFGVDAGSIRVTVTDPSLGRVFEHEATPVSTDGIDNWYQYLFAPIELVEDFVVLEVPAGTYGTIDISLDKPGGEAKLGALVLGQTSTLGVALYGTSIRLRDFSRKERDAFGNFVIQERDFSKVAEFDVAVDTANISAVQRTVAQYRAKPVVWIGEAAYESTIIYGFCTDFGVSISGPTISDATFSVEGLN
ncbi:phage head spike fiber domain-containing protein [Stutzerimonas kunmingensis]|uniref:phage head spike fiber domain-containing protein n=1 Tax=Stutzerimonas kunmingensis TaxID=1211807 RepID=UPI0040406EFD